MRAERNLPYLVVSVPCHGFNSDIGLEYGCGKI